MEIADDPLAGTHYRTVAVLGQGGMGEVLEAEHPGLGIRVAVKVIHARLSHHLGLIDRMRLEVQTLAALRHPSLPTVSDAGTTADGRAYFVMERLHGRNLKDEVSARGYLPVAEALEYMQQALHGLAAAHQAGVIHRDVKPENLFLCDAGHEGPRRLKVLDFGVAKVLGGRIGAPAPPILPTEEGIIVGTPRYFSPEQMLGCPIDERTDIFAAGIVLYKLLTGRRPFDNVQGRTELALALVAGSPEPPSHWSAQPISPELDAVVLRALAVSPSERFPTAKAFAEALGRIAAGRAHAEPAPVVGVQGTPSASNVAPALEGSATPDAEKSTVPAVEGMGRWLPRPPARGAGAGSSGSEVDSPEEAAVSPRSLGSEGGSVRHVDACPPPFAPEEIRFGLPPPAGEERSSSDATDQAVASRTLASGTTRASFLGVMVGSFLFFLALLITLDRFFGR